MNILLLTNSISFENNFIKQLYAMKHEVFCSERLLDLFIDGLIPNDLLQYFHIIIFSETILNQVMYQILSKCDFKDTRAFLKTTESLTIKEQQLWTKKGITHFISGETIFDHLRELLSSNSNEAKKISENNFSRKEIVEKNIKKFVFEKLSSQEQIIFTELERTKCFLSSEELSKRVWGSMIIKSSQSRISSIIKNINIKLISEKFYNIQIITKWKKGYFLINDSVTQKNDELLLNDELRRKILKKRCLSEF